MSEQHSTKRLRAGMVGVGMIFEDTYWPFFLQAHDRPLYSRQTGVVEVELAALASRTGKRAAGYLDLAGQRGMRIPANRVGADGLGELLAGGVDAVCIATPDDRHFDSAKTALLAGKHVLIEKPSVLSMGQ